MTFQPRPAPSFPWDAKLQMQAAEILNYASYTADKRGRNAGDLLLTSLWLFLHPSEDNDMIEKANKCQNPQDCVDCHPSGQPERVLTPRPIHHNSSTAKCVSRYTRRDTERSRSPPVLAPENTSQNSLGGSDCVLSLSVESEDPMVVDAGEDRDERIYSVENNHVHSAENTQTGSYSAPKIICVTGGNEDCSVEDLTNIDVDACATDISDRIDEKSAVCRPSSCDVRLENVENGEIKVSVFSLESEVVNNTDTAESDNDEADSTMITETDTNGLTFQHNYPHIRNVPCPTLRSTMDSTDYNVDLPRTVLLSSNPDDKTDGSATQQTYMYMTSPTSTHDTELNIPNNHPVSQTNVLSRGSIGDVQQSNFQSAFQTMLDQQATPMQLLVNVHSQVTVDNSAKELTGTPDIVVKEEPVDTEEELYGQSIGTQTTEESSRTSEVVPELVDGSQENYAFMAELREASELFLTDDAISFPKFSVCLEEVLKLHPNLANHEDSVALRLLGNSRRLYMAYKGWKQRQEERQQRDLHSAQEHKKSDVIAKKEASDAIKFQKQNQKGHKKRKYGEKRKEKIVQTYTVERNPSNGLIMARGKNGRFLHCISNSDTRKSCVKKKKAKKMGNPKKNRHESPYHSQKNQEGNNSEEEANDIKLQDKSMKLNLQNQTMKRRAVSNLIRKAKNTSKQKKLALQDQMKQAMDFMFLKDRGAKTAAQERLSGMSKRVKKT